MTTENTTLSVKAPDKHAVSVIYLIPWPTLSMLQNQSSFDMEHTFYVG